METAADSTRPAPPARTTLLLGLLGAVLCYLAHPPVGWSWLAWIGPAPWIYLARADALPGRRPYRTLWLAGFVYWALTVQWLRLPHPMMYLTWLAMAGYLGAYIPLFVGLTRVAHLNLRFPLWIAAPVVWTGLEWVRGHLFTGFLMGSLAHTQVDFPAVIQLAGVTGEYGVTFLIVLTASCVAAAIPSPGPHGSPRGPRRPEGGLTSAAWQLSAAAGIVFATVLFGAMQMLDAHSSDRAAPLVAIVQSDMLSDWKGSPERDREVMQQQIESSLDAIESAEGEPIDLFVWPETMFRQTLFTLDESFSPGWQLPDKLELQAGRRRLVELAKQFDAALLVGIDRVNFVPSSEATAMGGTEYEVYNSSVFVTPDGDVQATYDKMHLLPFGEYIPFADWLPMLGGVTPITGSATPGAGPAAFEYDDVVYAPNICYETVLPHLIRRQVVELAEQGRAPDVLVNLTNDAWYWGSAELDMHLASGVFRAVEMGRPLVIAANRGLSAYIDHVGRIVEISERDRAEALLADVAIPPRSLTIYARWGDWLPGGCLLACAVFGVVGARNRKRNKAPRPRVDDRPEAD